MQPDTSRIPRNALGQARWDDTKVNYWTRGDGQALLISNKEGKNKAVPKKVQCNLELIGRPWVGERLNLAIGRTISEQNAGVGGFKVSCPHPTSGISGSTDVRNSFGGTYLLACQRPEGISNHKCLTQEFKKIG